VCERKKTYRERFSRGWGGEGGESGLTLCVLRYSVCVAVSVAVCVAVSVAVCVAVSVARQKGGERGLRRMYVCARERV